ncbi:hypothetical protein JFK97_06545 [Chromobacterium phragmitis]|uniref:hypothetical protein n=1 Tax=Chromobacterium amazonense TaxID=1382803 RepID=UPI0021B805A3|nr:hypothetical protein [Chromobacterium amazonense]MBM2884045.1 hypothetical protein [Chromobacterium amazonense]
MHQLTVPIYRYTLRRGGEVIYIGPEPPAPEPGSSCTRMEWVPGPEEWGGRWTPPEVVF